MLKKNPSYNLDNVGRFLARGCSLDDARCRERERV
jgi:hypothetical protein